MARPKKNKNTSAAPKAEEIIETAAPVEAPVAAAAEQAAPAEAPKAEKKKPAEKKTTEKSTGKKTADKSTEKKAADKSTEKKTADKSAEKKSADKSSDKQAVKVRLQFSGKDLDMDEIVDKCKAAYKGDNSRKQVRSIEVYVKPEEKKAYFVVNGKDSSSIEL